MGEPSNESRQIREDSSFGKPIWLTIGGFILANFAVVTVMFSVLKDRAEEAAVRYIKEESSRTKASYETFDQFLKERMNRLGNDLHGIQELISDKKSKAKDLEEQLNSLDSSVKARLINIDEKLCQVNEEMTGQIDRLREHFVKINKEFLGKQEIINNDINKELVNQFN